LLGNDRLNEDFKGVRVRVRQRLVDAVTHHAAEHDPIVRRVGDGKPHIREAQAVERVGCRLVVGRRCLKNRPQCSKPLLGHGRQQRLLVGEVPIKRGSRHAESRTDVTKRQAGDTARLNRAHSFLHHRARQVAVVVPASWLPNRFGAARCRHGNDSTR
jgi:hypothetical protein